MRQSHLPRRDVAAAQDIDQQFDGPASDQTFGLGDGRERGLEKRGEGKIVEADDRNLARSRKAGLADGAERAHGQFVAKAEYRRDVVGEEVERLFEP